MRTALRSIALSVAASAALLVPAAGPAHAASSPDLPAADMNIHIGSATAAEYTPGPPTPTTYTVGPGDSVSALAAAWSRTPAQVAWVNHLTDPNLILVGQVLSIPPADAAPPPGYTLTPPPLSVASPPVAEPEHAASPATTSRPQAAQATVGGVSGFEACVIARESGGNPQVTNGSGHWGLYQFSYSTWVANGGAPASFGHASPAAQHSVFVRSSPSNWSPYDSC